MILKKRDFITFKMNKISIRKRIVDTDVVNVVTCTRQSVITRVGIQFLLHDVIHYITATSCDKTIFIIQIKDFNYLYPLQLVQDNMIIQAVCIVVEQVFPSVRRGWSGGAMVLGKLPGPGHPTIWMTVGQGPIALAVGAGGGCLDIFTLLYLSFSYFSLSLGDGPI